MDDDLARHLPDPPPPRPAARRAALDAAMARFDGTSAPVGPRHAPTPRGRWRLRPGPLGAFASIVLVALVGIPIALDHRDVPGEVARRQPATDAVPRRVDRIDTTPADVRRPPVAPAPVTAPSTSSARAAHPPETPLTTSMSSAPLAMVAEDVPPPPPPPPAPVPAPAPPAPVASAPSVVAGDITVTGVRVANRSGPARAACDGADQACTPDAADTALRNGLSALADGDTAMAIAAFDRAIRLRPTFGEAYLNRAIAYRTRGDLSRAEADIDRTLRYDRSARAYRLRSEIRAGRGDAKGARRDADRADRLDTDRDRDR